MVIDDDSDLRALLRIALEASERFEVAAEAPDGQSALGLIEGHRPDIVIVDLRLPDVTGFDLIPRLHALAPDATIVIFTGTDLVSDEDVARLPAGTRVVLKGDLGRLVAALDESSSTEDFSVATMTFERHPASARAARRFVSDACKRFGCPRLAEDMSLVVSELAANAFVHAGSRFEVRIKCSEQLLRVEVSDSSPDALPDPQTPARLAEHGRGLLLVSTLSNAWGIQPTENGKIVWAEMLRASCE